MTQMYHNSWPIVSNTENYWHIPCDAQYDTGSHYLFSWRHHWICSKSVTWRSNSVLIQCLKAFLFVWASCCVFWTKEEVHIYRTFTFIVGIKLCHLTLFGLVCIVHYRSTWSIMLLLWILIKTLGNRNVSIQCQWCQWCRCVLGVRLPDSCWCKQLRIITKLICDIFTVYIAKEFVSFVFGAEEKIFSTQF